MTKPFLVSFSGLPGVGKTTIALALSRKINAFFLRADTIEHPIMQAYNKKDIGSLGYTILADIAQENISLGKNVIIDCVNPLQISRDVFFQMASKLYVDFLEIEVCCHDRLEHKLRVETRKNSSVKWPDIVTFHYENWQRNHLILDSFLNTPQDNVDIILHHLKKRQGIMEFSTGGKTNGD